MKLVFFFVCAVAAFQGLEARSVEVGDLGGIIYGNHDAIVLLAKINYDIAFRIPQIIAGIVERITQVAGQTGQFIDNIRKTIHEIIELGKIAGCDIDKRHLREQIETLADFAKQGLQNCVSAAKAKTDYLQDQVRELLGRVQNLQNHIVDRTVECVNEHPDDLDDLEKCLRDQVKSIKKEVGDLQAEVSSAISGDQEAAASAVIALGKCSVQLQEDIAERQCEIIGNIRECIAENQHNHKH